MPRQPISVILNRAVRLRCPRCGIGPQFRRWFSMNRRCPNCDLKYERGPGYFLGSAYINYGVTSVAIIALYMSLHFGAGYPNEILTLPLLTFCVVFPLLSFRHSRSLWMSMDYFWDADGFDADSLTP
jgi:uncharacterized protein (DUF983 family)